MRQFVQMAVAVVMVAGAARAEAQTPTVQQLYDKFATAVGGRDAWKSVQGRTEKGTTELTFAGVSGSYERHSALPNKLRMIIDLGVARIDQGFDGEQGWADMGQGLQRMSPEQEKNMAEPSANGAHFLDHARFAKAEVVGKEVFEGTESYRLNVVTKAGIEIAEFFDVTTGLKVGTIAKTPVGDQKTVFKEYKEFEGKKIATKWTQATPNGDIVYNIQTVTFGIPDASLFKSPGGF